MKPDIRSRQSMERIPAIVQSARQNEEQNVPALIRSLDDGDPAVRLFAIRALREMTGQDFGYVYYVEPARRRPAIDQWRAWYNQQHPEDSLGQPDPTGPASQPAASVGPPPEPLN